VNKALKSFFTAFFLVFLAELGDRTQIISFSSAAQGNLLSVILGSSLALIGTSLMAVFLGTKLTRHISTRGIKIVSGILFIITGVWILLRLLGT